MALILLKNVFNIIQKYTWTINWHDCDEMLFENIPTYILKVIKVGFKL